jgi:hypothetical protein
MIKEMKMPNLFTAGKPGQKWYMSFLKRHPKLSEKVTKYNCNKGKNNLRASSQVVF